MEDKKQRITRTNILSYLKHKKECKYTFSFPWLKKPRELVIELTGLMKYWTNNPKQKRHFQIDFDKVRETAIVDEALKAYKERIKKEGENER